MQGETRILYKELRPYHIYKGRNLSACLSLKFMFVLTTFSSTLEIIYPINRPTTVAAEGQTAEGNV